MTKEIDLLKPILLADYAMNTYSQDIVSTFMAYDKMLPEKVRFSWYLEKYKYLQERFFKRFFKLCRELDIMEKTSGTRDKAFDLMDDFENYLNPVAKELKNEVLKFLQPYTEDPDNIALLVKVQMNNVLIQMADKLHTMYYGKRNSLLADMLKINNMFIFRIDDRKTKKQYNDNKNVMDAVQKLVDSVKSYSYEMENLQ